MTNIISVNPDHQGSQVTLKAVDGWLAELTNRIIRLEQAVAEKDVIIKKLEADLMACKNSTKTAVVPSGTKPLFSSLFESKVNQMSESEKNILAGMAKECNEITKKENSLVIFGLKEAIDKPIEDRLADDLKSVKSVLNEIGIEDKVVKKVYRIKSAKPKHSTSSDGIESKPNPLVVELGKDVERIEILKRSKSLKGSKDFGDVFIRPNLTFAQRELQRKLIRERNDKNNKLPKDDNGKFIGDHYYGIRDDQVVKIKFKSLTISQNLNKLNDKQ